MIEIIIAIIILIIVISIGIFLFTNIFGCDFAEALKLSIYVTTTLGPAEVKPKTNSEKIILSIYSLFSTVIFVGVIAFLIGTYFIATYIKRDL